MEPGTIINVIIEKVGSYVQGTNFVKGDYIPTVTQYMAKVAGYTGRVALDRAKILAEVGGQRITESKLAQLIGQSVEKFLTK